MASRDSPAVALLWPQVRSIEKGTHLEEVEHIDEDAEASEATVLKRVKAFMRLEGAIIRVCIANERILGQRDQKRMYCGGRGLVKSFATVAIEGSTVVMDEVSCGLVK